MSDIEQRLREGIGRSGISGGICADDCDAANRLLDEAADTIASLRSKLEEAEGALEKCQQVLAMLTSGDGASGPGIPSAYFQCVEAELVARRTLASLREADHA